MNVLPALPPMMKLPASGKLGGAAFLFGLHSRTRADFSLRKCDHVCYPLML